MKTTAPNLRTLVIGVATALLAPALMAQSLQVFTNTAPVTQASPYKSLNPRFFSSYSQVGYVEATLNFDSTRFSVYSITSYVPHECRLVGNKVTMSARTTNGTPFPNQSTIDFCQVWLKLKVGAAPGTTQLYYSPAWMYNIYGDLVSGATISASMV